MLALGPWVIRWLRRSQIGQVVRREGPETHRPKAGHATMGGLLILGAAITPTLLWVDLRNSYVWVAVLSTLGFGLIASSTTTSRSRAARITVCDLAISWHYSVWWPVGSGCRCSP